MPPPLKSIRIKLTSSGRKLTANIGDQQLALAAAGHTSHQTMRTMGLLVDIQHHRETIAVLAQRDSQRMDRVAFLPAAADVQLFGVADPQHIQEAEVRFQFLFLLRILQPDMAQIAEQRLRVLPEVQHRLEHLFLHGILTAQRQLHVIHIQDRIAVAGQELFAFAQLDQRHADIAFYSSRMTSAR